ncbi:hypothetical protein IIU_06633 [Bacillus cereus VD133]|uniref:Crystaline entomocidal protoxin n=1 Tax=Bacillus cereus VD133 TaxID=1053233 RepID=A0A9W5UZ70_BACCE|nr:insecticidal delta-endotoxin Cry8Ea1 family protein [Bacillus cereus]EOO24729.1 hypothetical protein IIU_06633 [Bacillus cereus VD133]
MKNKKKYMKPLAVGLLASNILAFGSQTVAFAATDKAPTKEQEQKELKTQNTVLASVASDTSELQKMIEDAITNKDTKITPELVKKLKDKGFDYISIVKAVTSGVIKKIPAVGSYLSPVVDFAFPKKHYVTKEELWGEIQDKVSNLIDQKLTEKQINSLVAELEGVQNLLKDYQVDVGLVNGIKPTVEFAVQPQDTNKENLRKTIGELDKILDERVPTFAVQGFEAVSIPYYVQIANVHLFLLKDAVTHAEEWGFTEDEKTKYLSKLQQKIKEYSNNVYTYFTNGVEAAKKQAGNPTNEALWNKVNGYVRTMTSYGLDFAALWPTFDPSRYNQPTNLQQTREVYSDMMGQMILSKSESYDTMLSKIFNSGYTGYPGELKQITVSQWDRIDGIKQVFNWNGDNGLYSYNDQWGSLKGDASETQINITPNNPAIGTTSHQDNQYLNMSSITHKKDNKKEILKTHHDQGNEQTGIASANQKLSRIKVHDKRADLGTVGGFVNAYIPEEIHPENYVDTQAIVGIPAEKYSSRKGPTIVMEYMTGSNAVVSSNQGDRISYNIENLVNQKYKIRLRVATNSEANVGVVVNGTSQQVNIKNTEASATDNTGIKGKNGTYMVIDGPEVNLKPGKNNITIENTGGKKVVLDRIEFVPEKGNPGWAADKKHYYKQDGSMATSWQQIDGKWYFFKSEQDKDGYDDLEVGEMATGWRKMNNGKSYYFNKDGVMQTGWLDLDGKSYHLQSDGIMKTGCLDGRIGGKKVILQFDENGALISLKYTMSDNFQTVTDPEKLEDARFTVDVE